MKLYILTECDLGPGDDESDCRKFLTDSVAQEINRDSYSLTCIEASCEDVTLDMLIEAVENELEDANRHDLTNLPSWLADMMGKHLTEDQVKQIFWTMIQDKGLLWV